MPLSPSQQITCAGQPVWDEDDEGELQVFGRSRATRTLLTTNHFTLAQALGGYAGYNVALQYQFVPNVPYPDDPGLLFFTSYGWKPIPAAYGSSPGGYIVGPNGMLSANLYRCKVTYQSIPYVLVDQGTLNIRYSATDAPQVTGAYYYGGNTLHPIPDQAFPALFVATATIQWTQYNQLSVPTADIFGAMQYVLASDTPFGAAVGTFMYVGTDTTRRMTTTGVEAWDITSSFAFNAAGWNNVFYPKSLDGSDTFVEAKDGAGNPPYSSDTSGFIAALLSGSGAY